MLYLHDRSTKPTATQSGDGIDYSPATKEEKQQAEASKDRIVVDQKNSNTPTTSPDGKKTVTPVITQAMARNDTIVVEAYVQGVFEDTGTCTVTFTNGSSSVTKQVPAFANATTTDCQSFTIARSEFKTLGTWKVTVSYSSPTATGVSSQNSSVEIK